MCGLCGMIGPGVTKDDLEFIRQLSYVCGLRGTDGTGVVQGVSYRHRQNVFVEKDDTDINFFMKYHSSAKNGRKEIFDRITDNLFMVHVRAATLGGLCQANSHPFEFDNIIGMHNGTLRDKRYLDDNFRAEKRIQKTDSELLFRDINERGLVPVLRELDNRNNAYALAIYNKKTGLVDFVRNDKRTLWIAVNKKRNVTYWASEEEMLKFVADRVGIEIETWYFKPHVIYSFRPDQCRIGELPDWDSTTHLENNVKAVVKDTKREEAANNQNFVKPSNFRGGKKLSRKERKRQANEAARIAAEAKRKAQAHKSNVLPLVKPAQDRENMLTAPSASRDEEVKRFLRENRGRQFDVPCAGCDRPLSLVDQFHCRDATNPEDYLCDECSELKQKMRVH